jgi:hypothetical protein
MRTELDRPKGPIMNEPGDTGRDAGTCVLRASGLRKEYGKAAGLVRAFDGVSLDVDAGQATALDARHQLAVARSLGATPQQVSAGLSAAQLLAAVPGTIVGIPAGIGLFYAASQAGTVTIPPALWLLTAVLETLLVLAGLTTIPARITARRPVAEILQSETA